MAFISTCSPTCSHFIVTWNSTPFHSHIPHSTIHSFVLPFLFRWYIVPFCCSIHLTVHSFILSPTFRTFGILFCCCSDVLITLRCCPFSRSIRSGDSFIYYDSTIHSLSWWWKFVPYNSPTYIHCDSYVDSVDRWCSDAILTFWWKIPQPTFLFWLPFRFDTRSFITLLILFCSFICLIHSVFDDLHSIDHSTDCSIWSDSFRFDDSFHSSIRFITIWIPFIHSIFIPDDPFDLTYVDRWWCSIPRCHYHDCSFTILFWYIHLRVCCSFDSVWYRYIYNSTSFYFTFLILINDLHSVTI